MASELRGVADLTAKLFEMSALTASKKMRIAARNAMKIAYSAAQAGIPTWQPPPNSRGYHLTYKGNPAWPGYAFRNLKLISAIDKEKGVIRAVIGVSKEAYYAVQFVEFGTSYFPANPWLRNSLESTKSSVLHSLAGNIKNELDKIARKRYNKAVRLGKARRGNFNPSDAF